MELKSTGIIRRIDDLGRVTIPKELRRYLKIESDDPLEIMKGPEELGTVLVLAPYRPLSRIPHQVMQKICKSVLAKMADNSIIAVLDAGGILCSSQKNWQKEDTYPLLRDVDLMGNIYRQAAAKDEIACEPIKDGLAFAAMPIKTDVSSGFEAAEEPIAALALISGDGDIPADSKKHLVMAAELVAAML